MRRPVIDYREFRLSKLNDPQFSHLKLLFGWVVYFAFYFLTENLIPEESCHVVHCYLRGFSDTIRLLVCADRDIAGIFPPVSRGKF